MPTRAATVEQYLAELPEDRRAAMQAVRRVFRENLDDGYAEGMAYGMIGYAVPHSVFPAGYHCDPRQPLPFAGLGAQKNHMSLHMMCLYLHEPLRTWFEKAWKATGKKLDMGKACIRFKKLDDLALDVLAEAIRRVPSKVYIEHYQAVLAKGAGAGRGAKPASGRAMAPAAGRTAPKKNAAGKAGAKKAATKRRAGARR